VIWDRSYYERNNEIVEYKDFLKNQGYQNILGQVKKYGLAFIDNAPAEENIVEDIAAKFGVIRVNFNS
jgi:polysaccharide deacetylase 2 family uncharacterized protein YibQ